MLPLRHGGVGLTDPRETAKMEYEHSTQITNKLTDKIYTQKLDLDYNVQTEPTLLPISENDYQRKVNTADNARLDISARGLWNSCEKTFFDIRITHPTSQSYSGKSLAEVYQQHEKEKDKYNQRVIDIEKSSFFYFFFLYICDICCISL